MIHHTRKTCPRCHSPKMRRWTDLTDEEKLFVERLPMSAEHGLSERKKHRYCTRCWFEDDSNETTIA